MKKCIVINGGDAELNRRVVNSLKSVGFCQELSTLAPVTSNLPASLRVDPSIFQDTKPFETPITVEEHHVRHFFSKVQNGVVAVQRYVGKLLTTPKEAIDYFAYIVGAKAYGNYWLATMLAETIEDKPDGVYLITDLDPESEKSLKGIMGQDFIRILLMVDDQDQTVVETSDICIVYKPKDSAKKVSNQIITKLNLEQKLTKEE